MNERANASEQVVNLTTRQFIVLSALLMHLSLSWIALGQTNWQPAGYSGSGLFPVVAVDPTDSDTIYLGSDVAGLYRSSDRGTTWIPSSKGLESLQVASLAIDPSNTDRLWLGTPMGLHRSTDGGLNWTLVDATLRCFKHVNTRGIAVSSDGQTILVASHEVVGDTSGDGTLYRSTDGGGSWDAVMSVNSAEIPAVVFDPIVATRVFSLVSNEGVRISSDSGASWTAFTTGLPSGRTWRQIDVGRDVVYATAQQNTADTPAGVFRSSKTSAGWVAVGPLTGEDPPGGLAVSDPVRIDPSSASDQRVFLGQDAWPYNFFVTSDGGNVWVGTALDPNYQFDLTNAPHGAWMDPFSGPQDIAVDPQNGDLVYYTTWVGLWASTDGGSTFVEKIAGAQNTCQTDVLSTGTAMLTTNMDGGVYRSTDNGATWVASFPVQEPPLDFWMHAWDLEQAANGDLYFAAGTTNGATVYRSTDDGVTWSATAAGLPNSGDSEVDVFTNVSIAADPNTDGTLYAAVDFYGLYKTTDSGGSWQLVVDRKGVNGPDEPVVKCVEVDPTNSQRIFMGEYWGGLWYSEDGGQTWTQTTAAGLEGDSVQEIVALPDGRVFAAYADGVYLSNDKGHSFSRAFPNVPGLGEDETEYVMALAVNPTDANDIAAATSKPWPVWYNRGSVWRSKDGGTNWTEVTGDLPVHRVRNLEYAGGKLWAATWCANLYNASLSTGGTVCVPSSERVCLGENGRFSVEATWSRESAGGTLQLEGLTRDSGVGHFGNADNKEFLYKVLDGRTLNGNFWFFMNAASDVAYDVVITDTTTGETVTYRKPTIGPSCAFTDTSAFPTVSGSTVKLMSEGFVPTRTSEQLTEAQVTALLASWGSQVTLDGAYTFHMDWSRLSQGGEADLVQATANAAYANFGNPENMEFLMKALDGSTLNGNEWIFAAGATDVAFDLHVLDRSSNVLITYSKEVGPTCAITDTSAFPH